MTNFLNPICCGALFSFLSFFIFTPLQQSLSFPFYGSQSFIDTHGFSRGSLKCTPLCGVNIFNDFNSSTPEWRGFLEGIIKPSVLGVQAKPSSEYTIILVGDSMTQTLGAGETIYPLFRQRYENKEINILNYGIGSTSILTLPDRLTKGAVRGNETLLPILDHDFDLILIESFGNNPLSNFSTEEGLKKQEAILDESIKLIKEKKPEAVIVFVATIAPNRDRYAENIVNLSTNDRKRWADERIAYIKNHIKYAKNHKIPLINLFEKSQDKSSEYINDSDFIHPSNAGLIFIGDEIAKFIVKNKILPL